MKKIITLLFILIIYQGIALCATPTYNNILIILDFSKSMNSGLNKEETKIHAAKKALKTILERIPDDTKLGLRVYGHSNGFLGLKQCSQTELISPIAANNKQDITNKIEKLLPTGTSPIELSLKKALKDLKNLNGNKKIILISDGIDTCEGDPCKFAREIQSKGLNIKIDVISFGSKLENFSLDSQLQCIASETQGHFERAGSRSGLIDALNNSIYIDKKLHWKIKPNY